MFTTFFITNPKPQFVIDDKKIITVVGSNYN